MTLQPGEEIGAETHAAVDQFFRFESGSGEIWIGGKRSEVKAGTAAVVPAGTEHNVKNTGREPLKLYTLYAPPQHADGTTQAAKADAEKSKEHFTGKTTE
jgi:mannose-6-phosphate isomerase-like protein (cupin superfamily)